jgi:hypothetical protein
MLFADRLDPELAAGLAAEVGAATGAGDAVSIFISF